MDTVRIARDFGTVAELLPAGIDDVRDLPFVLFYAIRNALRFLSWTDELPKDERPPRRIWNDGDKLEAWFDEVERRREEKYGTGEKGGPGPIDDPVENEAAKSLVVG